LVNQKVAFGDLRAIYQITPLLNATVEYAILNRKDETVGATRRLSKPLFVGGLALPRTEDGGDLEAPHPAQPSGRRGGYLRQLLRQIRLVGPFF